MWGGDGDYAVWLVGGFAEVVLESANYGVEGGVADRLFAPGEELEDLFGGNPVDVAVDVVLRVADGAAVGPDGAFRPSLSAGGAVPGGRSVVDS